MFCGNVSNSWEKFFVHLAHHMKQISMSVLDVVKQKETTIVRPIKQRIAFQQNTISPAVQSPFSQGNSSSVSPYDTSGTSVGDTGTPTEQNMSYQRISPNTYPTPGEAQQLPGSYPQNCTVLYSTSEYDSHEKSLADSFVSVDGNRGFSNPQSSSSENLQGGLRAPTSQSWSTTYSNNDGLPTRTPWTPDAIRLSQQPDALKPPAEHYPLLELFKPVVSHALLPDKTWFGCDLEGTQASTGTSRLIFSSLADQPKIGTLPPHVRPDPLPAGTLFRMQDVDNALRLSSSSQLIQSTKAPRPFRRSEHTSSNPSHSSGRHYPVSIAPNPVGLAQINALKRMRDEEYFDNGHKKIKRWPLQSEPNDESERKKEEQLLLQLKEVENLPWRDIAARFQVDLGKSYRVPALQMRFKRLRERLRLRKPL